MKQILKVGDRVTWCHSTSNGSRMEFRTREGRVVTLTRSIAQVKSRNGRLFILSVSQLRGDGEKTEVSELLDEIAKQVNAPRQT